MKTDVTPTVTLLRAPSDAWRDVRTRAAAGPHAGDAWIAYRRARGYQPLYLLLGDAAAPSGLGVAFVKRPRFRPWVRPEVVLDRAPWLLPDAGLDDTAAAAALLATARDQRWAKLVIQSFDGPFPPGDLAGLGFKVSSRWEFEVDLRPEEDVRRKALKSGHRRKIKKAAKGGVTVADETAPAAVALLAAMQRHTADRRSGRGETMDTPDDAQYRDLARHFVAGGGARQIVGRLDGAPVSTILLGVSGTRAYYLMGGTNSDGLACNAASLVMWEAMSILREAGVTTLNLGGVPFDAQEAGSPAHGLYRFKEGWGGVQQLCHTGVWRSG